VAKQSKFIDDSRTRGADLISIIRSISLPTFTSVKQFHLQCAGIIANQ
jgi:hypothetical protein